MANPILAAIISFFFAGLGQIYAGKLQKGIIMFVIYLILGALYYLVSPFIGIISLIYAIYAAYDAYQIAKAPAWINQHL